MKNKLPSLHSMNLILDCYSSLGKKKSRIGHSFSGYNCHLWKNEVMSPILITNNNTWMDDLKKIEGHFSKPFTPSKYTRKTPYFNLLTTGKRRLESKVISELKKMDWIASPSESSLNLWNSQIPLELPKNYHIKFGKYFDQEIYPEFLKTMEVNFDCDAFFMKQLNKMMKTINEEVFTILLCKNNKVVGAGLVAVKNEGAFLFCGSIYKTHRNKNLWKVLTSARQAVSAAMGAKVWITTTSVPQLIWRGDECYRITIFNKIKR